MSAFKELNPKRVFEIFEEMCAVPRGSGDMQGIADYCVEFAQKNSLTAVRDNADNVIIYKAASRGYESAEPVILQGHLDMVCQKTAETDIDFLKDSIKPYIDGGFIKAENTSLGADNGIAAAMILSILESNELSHPSIEAVFTADEEIGMIGAMALDMSLLKSKRMINIDSENEDILTVSCAGGSDFKMYIPTDKKQVSGVKATLVLSGLKGGHSGVEIDKGRVNADILLGRALNYLAKTVNFDIISVNGGNKANAIPNRAVAEICTNNYDKLLSEAEKCFNIIKNEISARECNFKAELIKGENAEYTVFENEAKEKLLFALLCTPNGITEMSAQIDGLVETSLNLGVLETNENENEIMFHYALRSNIKSALYHLDDRLSAFAKGMGVKYESFGFYPPWEFKENSSLQGIYKNTYKEINGKDIKVEAIHAGLECGVFASKIQGLDCISVGPDLFDVHTVNEKLSIESTQRVYDLIVKVLEKMK